MSEPLTTHEIEDVLSSIRRLVSEDLRPATRQAAATATPHAAAEAAEVGKLMLTPALRVVADVQEKTKSAPEPEPELVLEPGIAPEPQTTVELASAAPVPATEDHLNSRLETGFAPEDWSSADAVGAFAPANDVYDDIGLDEGDNGLKALLDTVTSDADVAKESAAEEEGDELLWSAPGEPELSISATPPSTEDVLQEAAGPREVHGHWTTQDLPGVDWVDEETGWVESEAVPFVAHPRKADAALDPLARAWADRAEAEVRAELEARLAASQSEAAAAETATRPELFEGDESEVDEEALRDIVRDIIREELAGALGERITRNVRKLVRMEINRALTAREFE